MLSEEAVNQTENLYPSCLRMLSGVRRQQQQLEELQQAALHKTSALQRMTDSLHTLQQEDKQEKLRGCLTQLQTMQASALQYEGVLLSISEYTPP